MAPHKQVVAKLTVQSHFKRYLHYYLQTPVLWTNILLVNLKVLSLPLKIRIPIPNDNLVV